MATTVIQQDNCDVAATKPIAKVHNTVTDVHANGEQNPPGENYVNWIILTEQKLQEREVSLLSIRLEIVKTAIHRTIEEFNNDSINYKYGIHIDMKRVNEMFKIINYNLITLCMTFLKQILSDWNGIDLSRSTKQFTTFRKYFVVSKNWFDQRKKGILTQHFWLNILESIREFAVNTAADICGGHKTEYSRYLLFTLIWAIFASKTQFSSTKPQPLIPGGTIKDTNDIKDFLQHIDDSLSMMKLLRNNGKECEQEVSAQQTLQFILLQLKLLSTKYKDTFHCNIQQHHINNKFNPYAPVQYPPVSVPSTPTVCSTASSGYVNNAVNNEYHPMDTMQDAAPWNTANAANNIYNYNECNVYNPNEDDLRSYYQHPNNNNNNNLMYTQSGAADIKPPRISNPFLPNINYNAYNQGNNSNITNIATYSAADVKMKMNQMHNENLNITEYPHLSNGNGTGYGPIHHSSYNVSDCRHSPAVYYQSNQNNCYQCNCNNCYI